MLTNVQPIQCFCTSTHVLRHHFLNIHLPYGRYSRLHVTAFDSKNVKLYLLFKTTDEGHARLKPSMS